MFERFFGKKKKVQERSPRHESIVLNDIRKQALSLLYKEVGEILSGAETRKHVLDQVMTRVNPMITEMANIPFSKELRARLVERTGAKDSYADSFLLQTYIKRKLNEYVDEQLDATSKEKLDEAKLARANSYESTGYTPLDLSNRPHQHQILEGGGINGGVYPSTEKTPPILVDDRKYGEALESGYEDLLVFIENEPDYKAALTSDIPLMKPAAIMEAVHRYIDVKYKVAEKDHYTDGGKRTLQHYMLENKMTPTAMSLLAGYFLEKLQNDNRLPKEDIQLKRTTAKEGGHAYVYLPRSNMYFDPAVLDHAYSAEDRSDKPHESYA